MSARLKLVRDERDARTLGERADRLRRLIREREAAVQVVAACDRHIAHEARRWADAHGLTLRPTVAQLKRELFS